MLLNKLPPGVCWRGGGGGGGGATGLLNKGGGSNRLPGLVNKLWNFHRYILVYIIILDPDDRAYVCNITPWLTPHFN